MIVSEFYNFLIEAIRPNKVPFVKGKRDMTGRVLKNNKELASLFSRELEKVGNDPNRLTNQHMTSIHKSANPGLQKHIDNMKNQSGDYWYKPKNGFGFVKSSQLKHAKHLVLAGDARLIITKLRDGEFDYSITNHGAKGSADYQHVLDYVKQVRGEAPILKRGDDPLTGKPREPKKEPVATPKPVATKPASTRSSWRMKGMDEPKKQPNIFQRLKSTLGMK
jgi:hypothetical protein